MPAAKGIGVKVPASCACCRSWKNLDGPAEKWLKWWWQSEGRMLRIDQRAAPRSRTAIRAHSWASDGFPRFRHSGSKESDGLTRRSTRASRLVNEFRAIRSRRIWNRHSRNCAGI